VVRLRLPYADRHARQLGEDVDPSSGKLAQLFDSDVVLLIRMEAGPHEALGRARNPGSEETVGLAVGHAVRLEHTFDPRQIRADARAVIHDSIVATNHKG